MTEKVLKQKFKSFADTHEPSETQASRVWAKVEQGRHASRGAHKSKLSFMGIYMKYKYILPVVLLAVLLAPAAGYYANKQYELYSLRQSFDFYQGQIENIQNLVGSGEVKNRNSMGESDGAAGAPAYYDPSVTDKGYDQDSEYQRKTASFSFATPDVMRIKGEVERLAVSFEGVITSSRFSASGTDQANYTVQIPVESFSEFVSSLRGLDAKIVSESISLSDRQEEYDLTVSERKKLVTRLDILQKQLTAAPEAQKAAIRAEIKKLETEITRVENQQKNIKQSTQFSNLTITINEDRSGFSWQTWAGQWLDGEQLLNSLGFMIAFWINVVIWLSIPVLLVWTAVRTWRNRRKKVQAKVS